MDSKPQKITLAQNPNHIKSGSKSYVSLLQKYGFQPTMKGPYFKGDALLLHRRFCLRRLFHRLIYAQAQPQMVLQKKNEAGTSGEVPAEDIQNDAFYLTPVSIGTPPQVLNLNIDTGSADLWVWSTQLPPRIQRAGASTHTIFNPLSSSTFTRLPRSTWRITYGDGSSASGSVGTDNIRLGNITVESQAIELAQRLSPSFQQSAGDGLLGLAFGTINTVTPDAVATPVENMILQSDIPKTSELFTAKLGSWRDKDEEDGGESFYTFGFIDEETVAKSGMDVYYVPVDASQGFWMFDSDSATVNGTVVQRRANTAIADTGTTLALVDDELCRKVYAAIPGATYDSAAQGYVFPTDTPEASLPVVTFAVGGRQFAVQKEDLGFAEVSPGVIYGGIQSRGDLPFDILGGTFLKAVYAIFDQGNRRFGVVQRRELTQNLEAPPS